MNYPDWVEGVPESIRGDPLWKMKVYRLALFVADIGWHDATALMKDIRTRALSDQLYRALGSSGANFSEGYSRSSGKDRARFYEYALGSARESRGWYFNGRHVLGDKVTNHRMDLLTHIIRLLLTIVPRERSQYLQEDDVEYHTQSSPLGLEFEAVSPDLICLLHDAPFA